MAWVAVGAAAVGVIGSAVVSGSQKGAAQDAANAQSSSSQAQIDESRRQFDEIRKMLEPYTDVGVAALEQQRYLAGLSGPEYQQYGMNVIEQSPMFTSLAKQGENAILQNASATGGLRGGNTQAALAQFRPQLLNQLIEQQYNRLGGLATSGQNSAVGVGTAGQNSSNQIINALGQQGAAQAGGALAQGRAQAGLYGGLAQAAGAAFGKYSPTITTDPYANVGSTFGNTTQFSDSGFGQLGSGFNTTGYPTY